MKTIVFIVPYPFGEAASQRFRFEQYVALLEQAGNSVSLHPFLSKRAWRKVYHDRSTPSQALHVLVGLVKRLLHVIVSLRADYVFIHREAAPIGPPLVEWLLARILRKKIVYDFDDAIWLTDKEDESSLMKWMKSRDKTAKICAWSHKVSCGNQYLADYAVQFNRNVSLIPTTIDTEFLHNRELYQVTKDAEKIIIGWTGSHSTLKYLRVIERVLLRLQIEFPSVHCLIIADRDPQLQLPRQMFRPWSTETEITDLLLIDIGIMPLPDDKWAKGKCGFKALQYMALEIPAVVSPVGVNTRIITNSKEGFYATSEDEWYDCLRRLILNESLRLKMGKQGRKKVIEHYSVKANASSFLSLFE